jgi:DNA-binding MurR/RpiR family transcriptional regulator
MQTILQNAERGGMLKLEDIAGGATYEPTPTQRKVLDFILKRPEEAVFLTATQLASQLEISDTSIVRLAQAMGYAGYPQMRRRIRDLVQPRISTVDRMDRTAGQADSVESIIENILLNDLGNLQSTINDLDVAGLKKAVSMLSEARRIYTISMRSAHCLSAFMASALKFLHRDVTLLTPGTGEIWEDLREAGPKDVVVGFSFPRYTKTTVEVVSYARTRGTGIIAITDSDLSPLSTYADVTLSVPYEMNSFMESFTCAMSLVNALVTALAFESRTDTLEILGEMERSWASMGVYWDD